MSSLPVPSEQRAAITPGQQTRIAAFLVSAHGALARRLALALPLHLGAGWQTELHAELFREAEIVSLLLRATDWQPDLLLALLVMNWELAWMPRPAAGCEDPTIALLVDLAAFGHALHGAIRPATICPDGNASDPFVMALRRIEFEGGRLMQGQIMVLKDARFAGYRAAVIAAVEQRHLQVRELWRTLLESIGLREQT